MSWATGTKWGLGLLVLLPLAASAEEIGFYKLIRKADGATVGAGYSRFEHHDPTLYEVKKANPETAFAEVEATRAKVVKQAEKDAPVEVPLGDFGGGAVGGALAVLAGKGYTVLARKKKETS